jgi:hypothetical protein
MSKLYKHKSGEKFEGYLPSRPNFINDNYKVSSESGNFDAKTAWAYRLKGKGKHIGVQKRIWRISPLGYCIDSVDVGKSET